jgi:hypothetical protein
VPAVTVYERTRKIVWIEAGGRCAICRRQVLTSGTETDDPSIFGEEAHIVSGAPRGPRAGSLDGDRLDSHENLILLCREHHKQIDDQFKHYTVERLQQIKQKHKEWIASLGAKEPEPLRIVPDPSFPQSHLLKMIFTGNALWTMVKESLSIQYELPDHLGEEDEELIVEFMDLVKDYADITVDLTSVRDQRNAEKTIGSYVSRLAERGFFVGANLRRMLLTGGVREEPTAWPILTIEIQLGTETHVVDADGNPLPPPDDNKAG